MIVVELKENENIDRLLKRFKNRMDRVGNLNKARKMMCYVKPTVRRKEAKRLGMYKQKMCQQTTLH